MVTAGQIVGVASALISALTLSVLIASNWQSSSSGNSTLFILICIGLLSLVAAYASFAKRPYILITAFVLSFVPVGFYLVLSPSWARIAGLAQLGYPVAAWLLLRTRAGSST